MPEDSKKNQEKRRNDPKEQRRSRRSRHDPGPVEKKVEKVEESKATPKVKVPQQPPVYESPGPEFYKNLKRETEEILKITEEESSKYKKKEIQSNWTKYEMPIESYEEIEEQENMGADYEKLIQAPLSIGGHFQFKHEKSWDINTAPSLYDKYFEINMDNLSLALSTIPFYERNNIIDHTIFNETEMLTMNNRATRYKQKYFNDKSYSTPETEAQEKILNNLKENSSKCVDKNKVDVINVNDKEKIEDKEFVIEFTEENQSVLENEDMHSGFNNVTKTENVPSPVKNNIDRIEEKVFISNTINTVPDKVENKLVDDIDEDLIFGNIKDNKQSNDTEVEIGKENRVEKVNVECELEKTEMPKEPKVKNVEIKKIDNRLEENVTSTVAAKPKEAKTNPVIESPEDLEKWLDDFLDG